MLVSGDSIEKQCLVKYRLLREKLKQYLVGTEDERVRKVHFVLERLLDGNELKGKGKRWEIMVVQNDIGMQSYTIPFKMYNFGRTIDNDTRSHKLRLVSLHPPR
jgi:hypothetical protein